MPQANTSKGFRRPASTDRLADAWDHIADLADDVDAYLGAGWITAGFTAAAGWSITASTRGRKIGPLVVLEINATRTGVALGSPATGDMSNTAVLSAIPAALRPAAAQPFHWIVDTAIDGGGGVSSAGAVSIYSMNPTASIPTNGVLSATVVYALDVA